MAYELASVDCAIHRSGMVLLPIEGLVQVNDKHVIQARNMALKSTSKYRLGAVIAHGKNALSSGFNNMLRTHPLMHQYNGKRHKYTTGTHAEVQAMIGVERQHIRGADLYVVRVLKDGKTLTMAKPCQICMRVMKVMGIKRVYYSTRAGAIWSETL
jgi:deoxycytidylate deaminase